MSNVSARSGRGRPPDPDLQARVFGATLDLYAEAGWARFSLDVLARRARVGKAALYSRWGSKEKLIVEALAHRREGKPAPAETAAYTERIVDFVLSAAQYRPANPTPHLPNPARAS
jgi:AcrR family transcriptional regulator